MRDAQRLHFEVLALELGPHGELLPASPEGVGAFAVLSNHGRMVRNLEKNLKYEDRTNQFYAKSGLSFGSLLVKQMDSCSTGCKGPGKF